jgi:arsenate reductase (glutaredoxin)
MTRDTRHGKDRLWRFVEIRRQIERIGNNTLERRGSDGYNGAESLWRPPMSVEIYHNPHCSKSRQTLELLQARGITPKVVKYLETPPDRTNLTRILDLLGLEPRELMRCKEAEYKAQGLDNPSLTRDQLIDAMITTPKLIERPIVIKDGKAAIGRPPEKILEIL